MSKIDVESLNLEDTIRLYAVSVAHEEDGVAEYRIDLHNHLCKLLGVDPKEWKPLDWCEYGPLEGKQMEILLRQEISRLHKV